MRTYFIIGLGLVASLAAVFLWPLINEVRITHYGHVACTDEAKLCPDGSAVGRTGSNCEFAACPHTPMVEPTSGEVVLGVGQTGKVGNLTIALNSFEQDYRCPVDVRCIQAGAVVVNVTLASGSHTETMNMPSDEVPQQFEGYKVSITNIAPPRESKKEIPTETYRVTFHVAK